MRYILLQFLATLVLGLALPAFAQSLPNDASWVRQKLVQLVTTLPSTRVIADRDGISKAFVAVNGAAELPRFRSFMDNRQEEFLEIRNSTVSQLPVITNGRTAVVSGRSIVGMVNALLLVKLGYDVEIFDKRAARTRNIQWAVRQSLLDELASLDPDFAKEFAEKIARALTASVHVGADGHRREFKTQEIQSANPARVPKTGADMLKLPSIMTVEAKEFETVFENFLRKYKGKVKLVDQSVAVGEMDQKGKYLIEGREVAPDEIVITEGANSSNRTKANIQSVQTTTARLQMAGVLHITGKGQMAKFYRSENGDSLITYTMETAHASQIWLVADIHASAIDPGSEFTLHPKSEFQEGTSAYDVEVLRLKKTYESEQDRLIQKEFRRLAAPILALDPKKLESIKISGVVTGSDRPAPFWLDQKISNVAISGQNLRLGGDAVGNATPTVGGGMQMGAVCHIERAKEMYLNLDIAAHKLKRGELTAEQAETLKSKFRNIYSQNTISDTLSWHRQGVPDMYLYIHDGGVKISRLSSAAPFAHEHNELVEKLERKLSEITTESVIQMSKQTSDSYYRVPPEEVQDTAGVNQWKKKLRDWAYQEFVREVFDLAILQWRKGTVPTPVAFLDYVLPKRPLPGRGTPRNMRNPNLNHVEPVRKVLMCRDAI